MILYLMLNFYIKATQLSYIFIKKFENFKLFI